MRPRLARGTSQLTTLSIWKCCAMCSVSASAPLRPGGRIAVNVANLGRKPYRNLAADITAILQDDLRLLLRGEVVWQKQRGASGSCAWGSYQSPANPVLRDTTERLIIASKGRFDRVGRGGTGRDDDGEPTVPGDEFWKRPLTSGKSLQSRRLASGHPAPFPVALVERCLHLFTYDGDVVSIPLWVQAPPVSPPSAPVALRGLRH